MTVTIREAATSDFPSIFELIQNELGYQDLDYERFCRRMAQMKADICYLTIVAETTDAVVGFLGFRRGIAYNFDGEYIQITALAVSKHMQNQGIGGHLLAWVEAYGRENNIHKLTLNSNIHRTAAHTFYEGNGYQKSSYAFYKTI